jgi:hypothetical protein
MSREMGVRAQLQPSRSLLETSWPPGLCRLTSAVKPEGIGRRYVLTWDDDPAPLSLVRTVVVVALAVGIMGTDSRPRIGRRECNSPEGN